MLTGTTYSKSGKGWLTRVITKGTAAAQDEAGAMELRAEGHPVGVPVTAEAKLGAAVKIQQAVSMPNRTASSVTLAQRQIAPSGIPRCAGSQKTARGL